MSFDIPGRGLVSREEYEEYHRLMMRDAMMAELRAEIERLQLERDNYIQTTGDLLIDNERLRAALALSQSQNYCTLCGAALDGTSGEHVATSGDRSNK